MSYRGEPYDEDYFNDINNIRSGGYTIYAATIGDGRVAGWVDDIEAQVGLVNGLSVIEYGCAFGYLCNELAQRGANVIGLDISEYAIQQAQLLFPELTFVLQDAMLGYGTPKSFDLIVSCTFLSCMPDKNAAVNMLNEFKRVLKNNGKIYMLEEGSLDFYLIIDPIEYQQYVSTLFPNKTITVEWVGNLPLQQDQRIVII